jgi:membrane AbrB-like protein
LELLDIILMLVIGWAGYMIFRLLRLPTPTILGAMTVVGIIRLMGLPVPQLHPYFYLSLQVAIGMFVGVGITREICRQLLIIIRPAALMSLWAIAITFLVGNLLNSFTEMDTLTAFLAAAPGGLTEIGIIAQAVGADVGIVTLLQLLRLVSTITLFPMIAKRSFNSKESVDTKFKERVLNIIIQYLPLNLFNNLKQTLQKVSSLGFIYALAAAIIGGALGIYFGIPAGGMLGAMFVTASLSIGGVKLEKTPQSINNLVMIGVGVMLGNNFSQDTFYGFYNILLPVLIFTVMIFGTAMLMNKIVQKITKWDPVTSFLATAPAGFIPMTLVAHELNLPAFEVSMMQLVRVLTIRMLVPLLIMFL